MNQEQTQNVFIGLLAAGLILLGGGMYLISQQVKSVATSVKGNQAGVTETTQPEQAKIAVEQYCDTEAGSTGLCFSYPKSWSVSQYNDSFTSGQKNLEIAANAAGGRVTIEKLQEGQKAMKGPRVLAYPGLYEFVELCSDDDGITCPQYTYRLTLDGDQTAFAVRVYYRFEDRAEVQPLIDTILLSLETGP
jgi:hypothetical protein